MRTPATSATGALSQNPMVTTGPFGVTTIDDAPTRGPPSVSSHSRSFECAIAAWMASATPCAPPG